MVNKKRRLDDWWWSLEWIGSSKVTTYVHGIQSWGIRKSAKNASTWLILPSGHKDKRQNSSDGGEIYSDRWLWRMPVVFNHCLIVICPDYPAQRALNHPGLTWFGHDCHWCFCINVHTWAKSSKSKLLQATVSKCLPWFHSYLRKMTPTNPYPNI